MPATQGDAEVVLELADLVATEPLGPRFETALADKTDPLKLIRRGTVEATFQCSRYTSWKSDFGAERMPVVDPGSPHSSQTT